VGVAKNMDVDFAAGSSLGESHLQSQAPAVCLIDLILVSVVEAVLSSHPMFLAALSARVKMVASAPQLIYIAGLPVSPFVRVHPQRHPFPRVQRSDYSFPDQSATSVAAPLSALFVRTFSSHGTL